MTSGEPRLVSSLDWTRAGRSVVALEEPHDVAKAVRILLELSCYVDAISRARGPRVPELHQTVTHDLALDDCLHDLPPL